MKISNETVTAIANAIKPLDTEKMRVTYREGNFPRADKVKDLDKRYRWDLFYAAEAWRLIVDAGYNDSHIDTALRSIVPPLN